jgi:hypothetical protein
VYNIWLVERKVIDTNVCGVEREGWRGEVVHYEARRTDGERERREGGRKLVWRAEIVPRGGSEAKPQPQGELEHVKWLDGLDRTFIIIIITVGFFSKKY